jgi:hypothetical protein
LERHIVVFRGIHFASDMAPKVEILLRCVLARARKKEKKAGLIF